MPPFYKHAAPLGLKAAKLAACHLYRRGLVSKPSGLGDPTPTVSIPLFSASLLLGVLALNFLHISREHMSPLWGFGVFVYSVFYKHAAPLGLNDPFSRFPVCVRCVFAPLR